jgi:hypothetical protein
MKRFLWALALMVVFCGIGFAQAENATVSEVGQSGWSNATATATAINVSGGNVSNVDLSTSASTARWAGMYGDVTGNLVLGESGDTQFMYAWTVSNAELGEVCVSQTASPAWASIAVTTRAEVDTAFGYAAGDDQAADFFTDGSVTLAIGGSSYDTTGASTLGTWEFGALETTGTPGEADLVFCTNISQTANNYEGTAVDFEMMVPVTTGADDMYYFFLELE